MAKRKVYLAGYIKGGDLLEKCVAWRNKIKEECYNEVECLDPLDGKEYSSITEDGLKSSVPPMAIIQRDYMKVKECDILVSNLDTFGGDRPMTGTLMEIAWAYHWHKPIIVITTDKNYKFHPFIVSSATIVETIEEAIELIKYYSR